jgi:predicted AlkP superfamily phosphohydrolase/phosphomutase
VRLFRRAPRTPRVVVLGLDGLPWSYLQRQFAAGELPNLRALAGEGALAQMDTSIPNVSSTAWATFMTGQNPGKHGIYGFVDRSPGSLKTYVPTSRNLRSPAVWEVLSEHGKRVFSMNVPGTFPSRPANGTIIGDFLSPSVAKAAPNAKVAEDLARFGYILDADPALAHRDKGRFLDHLEEVLDRRMTAVRHFWHQEPWDLFVAHVMETDRMHHFLWGEMEEGHPEYAPRFLEVYKRVDDAVGEVRSWLDEDTRLVVLSDHGFCSIKTELNVNTWLQSIGELSFTSDQPKGLPDLAPSSRAYALDPGRLFLNVQGREPGGCIAPGAEYERVRDELAEAALAITDPGSGAPMVAKVFRREELYAGPHAEQGADLVLEMHDGYDAKGAFGRPEVSAMGPALTGMHTTPDAFLYVSGAAGFDRRPHMQDLAPTLCALLGTPVPAEMDGSAVTAA